MTSPATPDYNCVAWSARDTSRSWQPGVHWPVEAPPTDGGPGVLEKAFLSLGYEPCEGGDPERGFEKVALYSAGAFYTHAARQLPDGRWTSKLGEMEDIEHDRPEDVGGGVYGEVFRFMRRATGDGGA